MDIKDYLIIDEKKYLEKCNELRSIDKAIKELRDYAISRSISYDDLTLHEIIVCFTKHKVNIKKMSVEDLYQDLKDGSISSEEYFKFDFEQAKEEYENESEQRCECWSNPICICDE